MSNTSETIISDSGLRMIETKSGTGKSPVSGQTIKAHYKGYLEDGTVFDSSYDRNQPFTFPVGQGRVIKGWDEAFLSMQKGSKRTLIIPPELGYGAQGAPPKIPGNSILLFDVELIDIN
jgi:peptidylprolyl isomerase